MKQTIIAVFLFFFALIGYSQEQEVMNAAELMSGSYMLKTPVSYTPTNLMGGSVADYTPEALFDGSSKVWCSAKNSSFPHEFVIELTEVFVMEKLTFNNICENYKGIATKEVKVEFSTESGSKAYKTVGLYTLESGEVSEFAIEKQDARWIRLTILSNHGNSEYTELAEFAALGVYKNAEVKPIHIDGKWETNWGWVVFEQQNASIGGYYKYNNGKIRYGGVNRNQVTYKWIETIVNQEGWTLLFLNAEGTRLTGVWCHGQKWSDYGFWIMERAKGVPIEPMDTKETTIPTPTQIENKPVESPAPVKSTAVKEIEESLKKEGKITLYGINFKTNSADITEDSYAILDQVATVLKQNEKLQIRIEGHTDNTGSPSYNTKLSTARSEAVKKYVCDNHSINQARIITEGKGEKVPVAPNNTASGRAANRRVEIHQVK